MFLQKAERVNMKVPRISGAAPQDTNIKFARKHFARTVQATQAKYRRQKIIAKSLLFFVSALEIIPL